MVARRDRMAQLHQGLQVSPIGLPVLCWPGRGRGGRGLVGGLVVELRYLCGFWAMALPLIVIPSYDPFAWAIFVVGALQLALLDAEWEP